MDENPYEAPESSLWKYRFHIAFGMIGIALMVGGRLLEYPMAMGIGSCFVIVAFFRAMKTAGMLG